MLDSRRAAESASARPKFIERLGRAFRKLRPWGLRVACVAALLLLIPLQEKRPASPQTVYSRAFTLFQQGRLADSQQQAERGHAQFQASNPEWAAKFQLLMAQDMLGRGMYADALRTLADYRPANSDPGANPGASPGAKPGANIDASIRVLAVQIDALIHQGPLSLAEQKLTQAELLCKSADEPACGDVLRARGNLALKQDLPKPARQFYLDAVAFARSHHDRFLEAGATVNLGIAAIHVNHYDEALDLSLAAYREAQQLGAENTAQIAAGNQGWAYLQLGDDERALEQFLQAGKSAADLGDVHREINWMSTAGYVYRDSGDLARAAQSYSQALALAKQLDSREDIVNALEDLAQNSVDSGKLDQAAAYLDRVAPMETANGNRLSANVLLTQGMLAAARRQNPQAERLFRQVRDDHSNPTTTRLGAGQQLARLFLSQGNTQAAEQIYKATLADFESARAQLKSEESTLPFVANAAGIYDDYIRLLVGQGRTGEALAVADRSRARTLTEGLGVAADKTSAQPGALEPRRIAQKTGATLLFYWLGEKQSCLWAITPDRVSFFPLPPQAEIAASAARYRNALLDVQDPLQSGNADGRELYRILVAPAADLIRPNRPVMILADGSLNLLNFETLLVPGPAPGPVPGPSPTTSPNPHTGPKLSLASRPNLHFFVEDATLLAAPSLAMLASAKPAPDHGRSLLLLGNPVSPSEDFPTLPLFGFEMKSVQAHFDPRNAAVFARQQATPAAYLSSNPARYSYIHFVSHAVSSRTDPLDSAIILSNAGRGANSYKLYARDVMRRPIDARLVTIAACSASGTRAYAGEGLVGLSWAFLRAGAQSVIGALWEVSDDSSPRLMNSLYQGLEDGQTPATALRGAKLALLHSDSRFRLPFYWAPFQIYTRR